MCPEAVAQTRSCCTDPSFLSQERPGCARAAPGLLSAPACTLIRLWCTLMLSSPGHSPAQPLGGSPHLLSTAQQSSLVWAGPTAVPATGCCRALGTHPTAPAPLKGTTAAGGQRGVSTSPSAPELEAHNGTRKRRSVKLQDPWPWVQEIPTTDCLCPLSASPSPKAPKAPKSPDPAAEYLS